jgi:hypothetical protein
LQISVANFGSRRLQPYNAGATRKTSSTRSVSEARAGPRHQLTIDCLEAILRERTSNSRTARRAAACGGDRDAVVLDFEFLSRSAPPSKQWRTPHSSAGLASIAEIAAAVVAVGQAQEQSPPPPKWSRHFR